jgi:hypothetical protein
VYDERKVTPHAGCDLARFRALCVGDAIRSSHTDGKLRFARSVCVSCGHPGRSRQHVIEQQLGEVLKASRPLAADMRRIGLIQRHTPPAGQEDTAHEWASAGHELVTTEVCLECNNEMILGLSRVLPAHEQKALATWAYKTVLRVERVRPGASFRLAPRAERVFRYGRPCYTRGGVASSPGNGRLALGVTPAGYQHIQLRG